MERGKYNRSRSVPGSYPHAGRDTTKNSGVQFYGIFEGKKQHNIHKCLDYAVRLGLIANNPSAQTELLAKQKYTGAKAFTPEQTKGLLELFQGDPLEVPVYLTATYGLRRSEVCGLRWDAVDFEVGSIHVRHTAVVDNGNIIYANNTKTATSNRMLPLTQSMRSYLLEVKNRQEEDKKLLGNGYTDSGYICVQRDGTPINPDFVTHHFQRMLKKAGLPVIRFHDLRHPYVKHKTKIFYESVFLSGR